MNTMKEKKTVERIRGEYTEREISKTEQLKKLDKKVRRSANVFAYVFGSVSALIFGTGMCFAMNVIGNGNSVILGTIIGLVGMGLCVSNYFIHGKILKKRKDKYASQILELCDAALNGEEN